jgi:outer membrane protein OmpA-like peptidoglycan-associated protein
MLAATLACVGEKDQELRRAILARRARFVASALAAVSASACGGRSAEQVAVVVPVAAPAADGGTPLAPAEPIEPSQVATNPPGTDSDGDGIADEDDKCPYEPAKTPDGCAPVPCLSIAIAPALPTIGGFDPGDAAPKPAALQVLDALAAALAGSTMELVIEGHVDTTEVAAVALSRALVVKKYLVAKGIAAKRLTVTSHGITRPADSNATAAGRERNRRVTFTMMRP